MKLSEYRQREGLSYTALGERLGISGAYAQLLAEGKRKPSLDVLKKIQEVTGGTVGEEFLASPSRSTPNPDVTPTPLPPVAVPEVSDEEREQISVKLSASDVEHARRIVWWEGGNATLTGVLQEALRFYLQTRHNPRLVLRHPQTGEFVEKPANEPYPPRGGVLRKGRPLAS